MQVFMLYWIHTVYITSKQKLVVILPSNGLQQIEIIHMQIPLQINSLYSVLSHCTLKVLFWVVDVTVQSITTTITTFA